MNSPVSDGSSETPIDDRSGPWRRRLDKALVGAAVLGIAVGAWGLWTTYVESRDRAASRAEIAEACDGIVDADAVLELHGGSTRVTPGSSPRDRLSVTSSWDVCTIFRVPGPGKTRSLFSLSLQSTDDESALNMVETDVDLGPFGPPAWRSGRGMDATRSADHSEPHPLGDGERADYTDASVSVRADCTARSVESAPRWFRVVATADFGTEAAGEPDEVSEADRATLARIAEKASAKAAKRLGCTTAPVDVPEKSATPKVRLGSATSARNSCAWYGRFLENARRSGLPDRALETPTSAHSSRETCLLAAGPAAVRQSDELLTSLEPDRLGEEPRPYAWWMRTASFFGSESESVAEVDLVGEQVPIRQGTSGGSGRGVWWASSVCGGKPALHVLAVTYYYDLLDTRRYRPLFQAYVEDIAERRGCTDVEYPDARTFERDWYESEKES